MSSSSASSALRRASGTPVCSANSDRVNSSGSDVSEGQRGAMLVPVSPFISPVNVSTRASSAASRSVEQPGDGGQREATLLKRTDPGDAGKVVRVVPRHPTLSPGWIEQTLALVIPNGVD